MEINQNKTIDTDEAAQAALERWDQDMVVNVAKAAHEINRAYCQSIGDNSQVPWDEAPEWQKKSAISGVKLHKDGNHGPEVSHEAWMQEKLDAGWVHGEVKDPEKKTHPCLVSFAELPVEQKSKDYIFRAVVRVCYNLPV
jgi:hypothetical protein